MKVKFTLGVIMFLLFSPRIWAYATFDFESGIMKIPIVEVIDENGSPPLYQSIKMNRIGKSWNLRVENPDEDIFSTSPSDCPNASDKYDAKLQANLLTIKAIKIGEEYYSIKLAVPNWEKVSLDLESINKVSSPTPCNLVEDTPPVQKLRDLYETNQEFSQTMDKALANVQNPYNGTENLWHGKTFDDFCNFFNAWYKLLPVNNGKPSYLDGFIPGQYSDEFFYIVQFSGFYSRNEFAMKIIGQEPGLSWTKEFVQARGEFMDSKESTATLQQWLDDPKINIDQYIVPPNGFQSFNEFFTRDIKPDMRTVASPNDDSVLVAPTDCMLLNTIQPITSDTQIPTKLNQKLNVKELLNGSEYAKHFEKGTAFSCILLPNTYHHYHAVISGNVVESAEDVAGSYWGVNDLSEFTQSYSAFEHFRRGYLVIETAEYGYVAMITVGLDTIGSVVFEEELKKVTSDNPVPIVKGDKVGHFAYGGSTVITLIEQGMTSVAIPQGQQIGVFDSKK